MGGVDAASMPAASPTCALCVAVVAFVVEVEAVSDRPDERLVHATVCQSSVHTGVPVSADVAGPQPAARRLVDVLVEAGGDDGRSAGAGHPPNVPVELALCQGAQLSRGRRRHSPTSRGGRATFHARPLDALHHPSCLLGRSTETGEPLRSVVAHALTLRRGCDSAERSAVRDAAPGLRGALRALQRAPRLIQRVDLVTQRQFDASEPDSAEAHDEPVHADDKLVGRFPERFV